MERLENNLYHHTLEHTHMEYEFEDGREYTHIEYNENIIRERSIEMKELATDIEQLAEISQILGTMIYNQGEKIDVIEKNIEESILELETSVIHLENANEYAVKLRRNIRNVAIVVGSITAGAFGFLAGPIVGIATTASGIAAGIGLVFAAEKNTHP
jgi:uncharacterized protein (DUF2164 family)